MEIISVSSEVTIQYHRKHMLCAKNHFYIFKFYFFLKPGILPILVRLKMCTHVEAFIFASSGNYFKTARLEESLVMEQPVPEDTADA